MEKPVTVRKTISAFMGARLVLALVLVLALAFGSPAVAYAQTSFNAQYGSPTAAGEAAIAASGPSSAASPATGVLPATGGTLLPLVGLGTLVLSCAGLLALRRSNL